MHSKGPIYIGLEVVFSYKGNWYLSDTCQPRDRGIITKIDKSVHVKFPTRKNESHPFSSPHEFWNYFTPLILSIEERLNAL